MKLLKSAHVYTPDDLGICDILIEQRTIIKIAGDLDEAAIRALWPELEVYDLAGSIVVPGIIDPHVHIIGGGGEASFSSRMPEISSTTAFQAGVTTVMGVLGTDSRTRTVGNLVAKARGLTEEGLTVYCLTGSYEYPSIHLTGSVGDDIVYLPDVLGVKLAIADHRCSNPTFQDLITLASQVRIASLIGGKPGLVHMHTGIGKQGLKIVMDALEHSDLPIQHFMPTHIRPTTPYVEEFLQAGGAIDLTSGNDPEKAADHLMHFLTLTEADKITVSSDANGTMPVWNEQKEIIGFTAAKLTLLDFLRVLVQKKGMPLSEALPFVSTNAAKRLHLYPQKGCLRVNADADLLVLDSDLTLTGVMTGGVWRIPL